MHVLLFPHKAEKIHTAKHVEAGMHATFYHTTRHHSIVAEIQDAFSLSYYFQNY